MSRTLTHTILQRLSESKQAELHPAPRCLFLTLILLQKLDFENPNKLYLVVPTISNSVNIAEAGLREPERAELHLAGRCHRGTD